MSSGMPINLLNSMWYVYSKCFKIITVIISKSIYYSCLWIYMQKCRFGGWGKCAMKKKPESHQYRIFSLTKAEYVWWVHVICLKRRKKKGKMFQSSSEAYSLQRCYWIPFLLISRYLNCSPLCKYCLQSPSIFVALMLYQTGSRGCPHGILSDCQHPFTFLTVQH